VRDLRRPGPPVDRAAHEVIGSPGRTERGSVYPRANCGFARSSVVEDIGA